MPTSHHARRCVSCKFQSSRWPDLSPLDRLKSGTDPGSLDAESYSRRMRSSLSAASLQAWGPPGRLGRACPCPPRHRPWPSSSPNGSTDETIWILITARSHKGSAFLTELRACLAIGIPRCLSSRRASEIPRDLAPEELAALFSCRTDLAAGCAPPWSLPGTRPVPTWGAGDPGQGS